MTKAKPKVVKSAPTFPDSLYVIEGLGPHGEGDKYFIAAADETELLTPGDKATIGIYRLVETCEMSADVVVTRKSAKK